VHKGQKVQKVQGVGGQVLLAARGSRENGLKLRNEEQQQFEYANLISYSN
jgi:hypothetical protein